MSDVVILGANGYLGRQLAHVLNQKGVSFASADIQETSLDNYDNYHQVDITKDEDLIKLPHSPGQVFMFAGLTGTKTDDESRKLYTDINEGGLAHVLDYYSNKDVHIIFPSTRLVYKGVKDQFLTEDAEKESKTIYAENKINCEQMLHDRAVAGMIKYTTFRICVPYGNLIDGQYSYGTLGFFLGKAGNGEDITLFGNGEQKRTFTHVKDIVDSILHTIEFDCAKNTVYNIGSGDALSLKQVAQLIAKKYNVNVSHIDWPEEALKIESGDTIFSDKKLIKDTNYTYQFKLDSWVEDLDL